jgi:hypothetical protein
MVMQLRPAGGQQELRGTNPHKKKPRILQPRHDIKTGANLNSFTYQGLLNNFL